MYVNCVYMRYNYKDFSVKDKGIFVSGIWFFFFSSEMKLTWLLIFSQPFGITSMNVTTNKHDTCTLHLFWAQGKDSDAGRDWGQEKGTTEDEMAGWHHWLDGHESEWTPGVGDGQGGLACCDSQGRKELDTTEWLNWTERIHTSWCLFWVQAREP